jgi:prepilin-type N-terminal cleavage/methylation domain-containing protein
MTAAQFLHLRLSVVALLDLWGRFFSAAIVAKSMPGFIEVNRGSETVIIDLASIVAVQHRGESHFIHTSGAPITVSRDLAIEVAAPWRKWVGESAKPSSLFANKAFSLIELVIVVTIIAIIASIALRRLSRHAEQGATNAIRQDLSVLQIAIERYRAEHGSYPTALGIADELTKFTDANGAAADTRTAIYMYGPYVRKIPPIPLGPARGSTTIAAAAGAGVAWIYDPSTGEIKGNESGP